jgi:hypothetical protein
VISASVISVSAWRYNPGGVAVMPSQAPKDPAHF